MAYVCVELEKIKNIYGGYDCKTWQQLPDYSGYKLTNEQMTDFILAIAILFATVSAIKLVKRSFF